MRNKAVQVELDREQRELVERAIATGRIRRSEDAIQEALGLWIERERRREELLAALDEAEQSIQQGESMPLNKASLREMARDVKDGGRKRARAIASQ
jgi:Arc/MetJ-type ribon-helix-helix transcriptional regulator